MKIGSTELSVDYLQAREDMARPTLTASVATGGEGQLELGWAGHRVPPLGSREDSPAENVDDHAIRRHRRRIARDGLGRHFGLLRGRTALPGLCWPPAIRRPCLQVRSDTVIRRQTLVNFPSSFCWEAGLEPAPLRPAAEPQRAISSRLTPAAVLSRWRKA